MSEGLPLQDIHISAQFTKRPNQQTVESVEIDPDVEVISILFADKTVLSFDLDARLVVFPELSDWKTGNWRGIKRWHPLRSKPSIVSWL